MINNFIIQIMKNVKKSLIASVFVLSTIGKVHAQNANDIFKHIEFLSFFLVSIQIIFNLKVWYLKHIKFYFTLDKFINMKLHVPRTDPFYLTSKIPQA